MLPSADWRANVIIAVVGNYERDNLMLFDDRGVLIIEHPWPAPDIRNLGNGQPRGPRETI